MLAEKIETTDSQNFTITSRTAGRSATARRSPPSPSWTPGTTARSLKNNQKNAYFFEYIDGYDEVHPDDGASRAPTTLSGLKVDRTTRPSPSSSTRSSRTWPDTLGYAAFAPLPAGVLRRPRAWLKKPVGNGPYTVDSYTKGSAMSLREVGRLPGPGQGAERRRGPQGLHRQQHRLHRPAWPATSTSSTTCPAAQLKNVKSGPRRPLHQHPRRHHPDPRLPVLRQGLEQAGHGEGPHGPVHGDQPRRRSPRRSSRRPAPPPPTGPRPVLGEAGGYKDGLCGDACKYNPAEAKKLIKEGGGLPGGQVKITYNADTGSHKEWVDAVCNSINNALGNDKACVGNPVGTFADFRNQITPSRR